MAVNTVNTTSSTSTSSSSQATSEELQQKIADAYAKLQAAAQEMGRSNYAQVQETISTLYNDYAEALKNPSQPHDFENDFVQLEAMKQVLQDPIKEASPNAAQEQAEKDKADRAFRDVTKKYAKSETQLAQEENLKGEADAKVANEHQERADRVTNMRTDLLRANTQNNRGQASESQGKADRAAAETKQGLFAALIKAPKAPTPESSERAARKPLADGAPRDAKPAPERAPVKTKSTAPQGEEVGEAFELAEAFDKDFEKPVDGQENEVSATEAQDDLQTVDGQENADGTKNNPHESMQLVQVALATGVLQPPVTAQSLDPKRDVTAVMREVSAECNGLLGECSEMQNSAMIFVMQGAVRNTKVQGLKTLVQGNTRNGEPEAALAELQRVKKSAGLAANGVASQGTTTPAAVLENGEISPSKSREQLAATVGQTARLNSASYGPLMCMPRSLANWSAKDAADTAGTEGRKRSELLA